LRSSSIENYENELIKRIQRDYLGDRGREDDDNSSSRNHLGFVVDDDLDNEEESNNSLNSYLLKQDMDKLIHLTNQLVKHPKVPTILKDMIHLKANPPWARDGFISSLQKVERITSPHKRPESRGLIQSSSGTASRSKLLLSSQQQVDKRPKVMKNILVYLFGFCSYDG